jgi:ABC-type branched-subunit amino acid transport system substrate-binding protein
MVSLLLHWLKPWHELLFSHMKQESAKTFVASDHHRRLTLRFQKLLETLQKECFFAAAYAAADQRPIAKLFNEMVKSRYGIHAPDHDFSQAYDLVRIMEIALKNTNLTGSLADDRTAIRDAIANVKGYQGLASGPISFCADATPQCRDGNRTAVLIGYTKGGEDFETEVIARVTMEENFGLE